MISLNSSGLLSGNGIDVQSLVQQLLSPESGQLQLWQQQQTDLQNQAKLQQGVLAVREASKGIDVSVAPRFGKWSDGTLDNTISGSLSKESDQTAAKRKAAENAAQQAQGQGQGQG